LDTIEDAGWVNFQDQDRAFLAFDRFIQTADANAEEALAIREWARSFPSDVVDSERLLLADAERIFSDFHRLPPGMSSTLSRLILSMSGGMRHYMERKARSGNLVLEGAADVNRYCFFVAGVVGEMLAVCRSVFWPRDVHSQFSRLRDAFRFGLFLQKVNLLKDQSSDEKQGRFLVPSRASVLKGLLSDADSAFRFLVGLPEKEVGFRLFCAWSLFLGLASLPWIEKADLGEVAAKIPREETLRLLQEVESRVQDNLALVQLYESMKPAIGELIQDRPQTRAEVNAPAAGAPAAGAPAFGAPAFDDARVQASLLALYQGELPESDVLQLFRAEL